MSPAWALPGGWYTEFYLLCLGLLSPFFCCCYCCCCRTAKKRKGCRDCAKLFCAPPTPKKMWALLVWGVILYVFGSWVWWGVLTYVPRVVLRDIQQARFKKRLNAYTGGYVCLINELVLLFELPMSICSLVYVNLIKYLYKVWPKGAGSKGSVLDKKDDGAWRDVSGEELGHVTTMDSVDEYLLPIEVNLVLGPRWNTHTIVYEMVISLPTPSEGLVEVENVKAYPWQVVAQDPANNQKVITSCTVDMATDNTPDGYVQWIQMPIEKPSGCLIIESRKVVLMIRPYISSTEPAEKVFPLPRVRVGGVEVTTGPIKTHSREAIYYNKALSSLSHWRFWALNWWAYPLLTSSACLPTSCVKFWYLPVANPETHWIYGVAHRGFLLSFEVDPAVLAEHFVFCTVYNRNSLPTLPSEEITAPVQCLPRCAEDGFWAVRVVRRDGKKTSPEVAAGIRIELLFAAPVPKKAPPKLAAMVKCKMCNFAVTGIAPEHCCLKCSYGGGEHGARCQRVEYVPADGCPPCTTPGVSSKGATELV